MCTNGHHRDPYGPRTMIVEFYECSQARKVTIRLPYGYRTVHVRVRTVHVRAPYGPVHAPYGNLMVTLRVLTTPSPKLRRETVETP